VILHQIAQSQYTRSHHRNRLAKLWAVYLKACGLSARAFDALHALGIVMSHKWTANAYGALSLQAMEEVRREVQWSPWIISHDNVNLPMRVFSQRLHNQSHFVSGCAGTVWVLPAEAQLPPGANSLLRSQRAEGIKEPFSFTDLLQGDASAHARVKSQYIHHVLHVLVNSPEFADYEFRDDDIFKPPPPVNLLPSGPQSVVKQFILGTLDTEEASYEGNDKVISEFYQQLGLSSEDEQKRTGLDRILVWGGDQMTVG